MKQIPIKDVDLATDWFRMTKNENEGTSKLIYDNHGVLVGATEVSDQAEDSIIPTDRHRL